MLFILLSTYNGSRYLQEQLDSVLAQSHQAWTLLARDDGSSDESLAMLRGYAQRDSRIQVLEECGNLGVIGSFEHLLAQAVERGGTHFLFCDQDDYWQPTKVARQLQALTEAGEEHPVVVHSDLEVVDEDLNPICPSFFKYMRFKVPKDSERLRTLCVQNYVTGCAMGLNLKAATLALPFPKGVYMHDWWLALTTTVVGGKVIYIDEPLIRYRQHANNAEGGRGGFWAALNPLHIVTRFEEQQKNYYRMINQLHALEEWVRQLPPGPAVESIHVMLGPLYSKRMSPQRALRLLRAKPFTHSRITTALLYSRLWRH